MKLSASVDRLPFEAEDVLRALAERVRVARRSRGFTQADVAAKADVSLRTMAAIEKGAPTVQMGYWLAVLWALDLLAGLAPLVEGLGREPGEVALLEHQLPRRVRHRTARRGS